MAQVEKNENFKELKKTEKTSTKTVPKKGATPKKKEEEKKRQTKKNLKEKTVGFAHGVKVETKRIHWPTRKDMIKYSIATIVFILFFAVFFYIIDFIFAVIHSLIG